MQLVIVFCLCAVSTVVRISITRGGKQEVVPAQAEIQKCKRVRGEVSMQISGVAKVASTADGKTVLEIAGRPAFEMNHVALSIWTKLAAGHSPEEISSQIAAEFSAPGEVAARDVKKFISKLKDNLLVYDEN
jgi:hypothetical protein